MLKSQAAQAHGPTFAHTITAGGLDLIEGEADTGKNYSPAAEREARWSYLLGAYRDPCAARAGRH